MQRARVAVDVATVWTNAERVYVGTKLSELK
jgi:hypothetical protein